MLEGVNNWLQYNTWLDSQRKDRKDIMENGKWKMENRKMENGKWKIENRKMENGKWKMENGKQKIGNRKWKMENVKKGHAVKLPGWRRVQDIVGKYI